MFKITGIYKIENLINHKCYIGQAKNIKQRWATHKTISSKPNSGCYHYPLYRAIRKYGLDNFSFEVIEECPVAELNEKERFYIKKFDSFFSGYNQTLGGNSSSNVEKEIIIGIIRDLENTNMPHHKIAEKWHISAEMVKGINTGRHWKHDREYPIRKRHELQKRYCVDCGKKIAYNAKRCAQCAILYRRKCGTPYRRKCEMPTKEQLENLLKEHQNFTYVAKMFGVSDNAVKKWCKKYGIGCHASDYKAPKPCIDKRPVVPAKSVHMIDKTNGTIIQTFPSVYAASKHLSIGNSDKHISAVCNGRRKTAYGYKWKFADEESDNNA